MKYAILGNPNCGKTTLFNSLTGLNQKVGNWSGVTIDIKEGEVKLKERRVDIVDLPGVYTLIADETTSVDERITLKFIIKEKFNGIINVIDSSNLERNLYLTMQLIETKIPLILAINMTDIARKKGITIDYHKLQKTLGCLVIPLIGRKKVGISELKAALFSEMQCIPYYNISVYYPTIVNKLAKEIQKFNCYYSCLWISTAIIEENSLIRYLIKPKHFNWLEVLKTELKISRSTSILLSRARYKAVSHLIEKITKVGQKKWALKHKATEIIDRLCMNKYLGMPIFLLIMYLMFEFSITIGGSVRPFFDSLSSIIFVHGSEYLGVYLGLPSWLISLSAGGLGLGINTVFTFIPQISCMFLFLSFLEDSGYMARSAYVMDRFMQLINLPGKAFVPLIVGFGCNVPSIMATRTLEAYQDRLATIMMIPFMSCGARLSIFAVFAAAFFPQSGSFLVFGLYVTGILAAIVTGYVVKFMLLVNKNTPFMMELPTYHMPRFRTIFIDSLSRSKNFIFKAGKVIIPVCILIGTLNNIKTDTSDELNSDSILSHAGQKITIILKPMGINEDNWQATVGLLTGILAKEVILGTLNTLYTQERIPLLITSQENRKISIRANTISQLFWLDIHKTFNVSISKIQVERAYNPPGFINETAIGSMIAAFGSLAAAFSYMLFVLLYSPCASVIGTMAKEGAYVWAWISIIWNTSIAYVSAIIVYQITRIQTELLSAFSWIVGTIIYIISIIFLLRHFSQKYYFKFNLNSNCNRGCPVSFCKKSEQI